MAKHLSRASFTPEEMDQTAKKESRYPPRCVSARPYGANQATAIGRGAINSTVEIISFSLWALGTSLGKERCARERRHMGVKQFCFRGEQICYALL
jgi:hypothetical protein